MLTLSLLGGLSLHAPSENTLQIASLPRSRKATALFIYLAHRRQPASREHLAALFYEKNTPSQARANLRVLLTRLNQLADFLDITRESVSLADKAPLQVDTWHLEAQLAPFAQQAEPEDCSPLQVEQLRATLSKLRGDFLAGFHLRNALKFEEWVISERERLNRLTVKGLAWLSHYHLESDEPALGLPLTQQWLTLDPFNETAHRQLMLLLSLTGRTQAALSHYHTCAERLKSELGVAPAPETTHLYHQLQHLQSTPKPTAPPDLRPHNLPARPGPLLGRAETLRHLSENLSQKKYRLLTLVGPGGVGKSHLALSLAHHLRENYPQHFPDGLFYVSLAHLPSPAQGDETPVLAEAILTALKLNPSQTGSAEAQVIAHLRDKNCLLVLDNLEQLLAQTGWLADLLQQALQVTVLTTSQAHLNLRAEHSFAVKGLALPPIETIETSKASKSSKSSETPADVLQRNPAVQLFLQQARHLNPEFEASDSHLRHIARLCHQVDGLPLGLILAADLSTRYRINDIEAALSENRSSFQPTQTELPARHHSLRAMFEHTWTILNQAEQTLLAQLSLFRGSFALTAALHVSQSRFDLLTQLIDKSLLTTLTAGRYALHATLRPYAAEKLAQHPDLAQRTEARHSQYYLQLLSRRGPDLRTAQASQALTTLQNDIENIRSAWLWALAHQQTAQVAQTHAALRRYYQLQGPLQAGVSLFRTAVEAWRAVNQSPGGVLYGQLLVAYAALQNDFGDYTQAKQLAEQAESACKGINEPETAAQLRASARLQAGRACYLQGDYAGAMAQLTQIGSQAEASVRAQSWGYQSLIATRQGRYAQAETQLAQAQILAEQAGDLRLQGEILRVQGLTANAQGQAEASVAYQKQALTLCQRVGDRVGEASLLNNLALIPARRGRYAESNKLYQQARGIYQQLGHRRGEANVLLNLGANYHEQGDYVRSLAQNERCLGLYEALHDQQGQAMAAINAAVDWLQLGRFEESLGLIEQAEAIFSDLGDNWHLTFSGLSRAELAFHQEDLAEAARLYEQTLGESSGEWHLQGLAHAGLGEVHLASEALAEAKAAFEAALGCFRRGGEHHRAVTVLAGLGQVWLAEGAFETAQTYAEAILYTINHTETQLLRPFRVYWACHRILRTRHDPRANSMRQTAVELLTQRAGLIEDPALRASFKQATRWRRGFG